MKNRIIILIAAVVFAAAGCKKTVDPIVNDDERARDILYGLMNQWYFWYKEMPKVTVTDYNDPYTLLNDMRYKPLDKWSFVADYDEFNSYYQGSFAGHGIRIGLDPDNKARIAMIYNLSPLYPEGVRRGWQVKSINGTDIAALLAAGNYTAYNNVMGPRQVGLSNTFVFTSPEGTDVQITSAKAEFQVNSVLKYDTIRLSTGLAGYLAFEAFIEPSFVELRNAFGFFLDQNVRDLILDLRYNSGGMLEVATDMASYIAGNAEAGKVFIRVSHNDKKIAENESILLKATGYSLDINRVAVITSRETASASENIINGLLPYADVKCFGDTTSGKPVGMYAFPDNKRMYVFAPVTFQLVNALDQGDYYNGIEPYAYAPDDLTRDFGDPDELSLREALAWLDPDGTKGSVTHDYIPARMDQGRPGWQRNLFVRTPDTGK
jgi:carboxyl-terminal processing protease